MDKVTSEQVIYRPPCYILCAGCDYRIEGENADQVVKTAERYGWRTWHNYPYCESCQKRHLDQLERYQGKR